MLKNHLKLFLILESATLRLPLLDFIEEVTAAGITALELRDKSFTERERFYTAKTLAPILKNKGILFIVNNSVDIAAAAGADGVHLGWDDFPPEAVKPLFNRLLVGCSCNTSEQAQTLSKLNIDYIGVGPLFPTETKKDHRPVLGLEGAKEILSEIPSNIATALIGGIDESNLPAAARLNAGICVSGAICTSPTPYETVKRFLSIIDSGSR
jgi:thiamine-phosphate pyrophosphorylase